MLSEVLDEIQWNFMSGENIIKTFRENFVYLTLQQSPKNLYLQNLRKPQSLSALPIS